VLCRAERYIRTFYLKGPERGALKASYPGSAISGKKYIAFMGFARGTEGKERYRRESVISGERYIRVPLYILEYILECF